MIQVQNVSGLCPQARYESNYALSMLRVMLQLKHYVNHVNDGMTTPGKRKTDVEKSLNVPREEIKKNVSDA